MSSHTLRFAFGAAVVAAAVVVTPRQSYIVRADDPVAIAESNDLFAPDTITISAGTTVIWTNNEDPNRANNAHDVVSDDGSVVSDYQNPGDSFSYTFNTPGTYHYICDLHDGMEGTITVQ